MYTLSCQLQIQPGLVFSMHGNVTRVYFYNPLYHSYSLQGSPQAEISPGPLSQGPHMVWKPQPTLLQGFLPKHLSAEVESERGFVNNLQSFKFVNIFLFTTDTYYVLLLKML